MTEAAIVSILVPLISAIATIVTVILTNRSNAKVSAAKIDAEIGELRKDIQRLEDKLEEYNGLNKRMYEAEEQLSVVDQRLKHIEAIVSHN